MLNLRLKLVAFSFRFYYILLFYSAKGRRTPQDALLAPIDEKPSPRQRKHSGSEKQRYKESPR